MRRKMKWLVCMILLCLVFVGCTAEDGAETGVAEVLQENGFVFALRVGALSSYGDYQIFEIGELFGEVEFPAMFRLIFSLEDTRLAEIAFVRHHLMGGFVMSEAGRFELEAQAQSLYLELLAELGLTEAQLIDFATSYVRAAE